MQHSYSEPLKLILVAAFAFSLSASAQQLPAEPQKLTVLRAAHLLDVAAGKLITPGEVLVRSNRIVADVEEEVRSQPDRQRVRPRAQPDRR